jgi:hypothetical protein
MQDMNEKLTAADVRTAVKRAVEAVLLARCAAEVARKQVDDLKRAELGKVVYLERVDEDEPQAERKRIVDPNQDWLMSEQDFADYCAELNLREREAGIKPASMPDSHCPALVAETLLSDAHHLLIDCAAEMLKLPFDGKELRHRLLCSGMENYKQFIELLCGLVVNLPDFKRPALRV